MTDTTVVDLPPPEEAPPPAPPPARRAFAADPTDRLVPVLSTEPPKPKPAGRARRAFRIVTKMCLAAFMTLLALFMLASLIEEPQPGRMSPRAVSTR